MLYLLYLVAFLFLLVYFESVHRRRRMYSMWACPVYQK
jgi:hypothetical protein